jgi:serine protease Do
VKLADNNPRIGDWVLAVGNPFGLGGTVTAGIVSARGRDIGAGPYDDFIQIDAPVNKGNSGGPTFDVDGNVIGVNTAIFSPSGGSVGIAFAIPADTVKSVVAQLRDKGSVTRGWIGVQIQTVTPDIADSMGLKQASGALVSEPQKNSPAAKAGIQSGDVITSVDGSAIHDSRELARKIGTMSPGTEVKLGVIHGGQDKIVTLTLGTLSNEKLASKEEDRRETPDGDVPKLGLTLAPSDKVSGADGGGVVVTAVAEGGIAADHGFQVGDVILDVGGKPVSSVADVRKSLSDARSEGKHTVLFRVKSNEGTKFVALPIGNA